MRGRPRKASTLDAPAGAGATVSTPAPIAPSAGDQVIPTSPNQTGEAVMFSPVVGNDSKVDMDAKFAAAMAEFEAQGNAAEPREEKGGKATTKAQADEPEDPVQKEMDDAEAAAQAAKLEVSDEPEDSKVEEPKKDSKQDADADEVEVPESGDDYAKWLNSLSKPARARIERQQRTIAKLTAAAASAITIAPSQQSPLSHVNSEEQLQAEKTHWETVRNEVRRLARAHADDMDTPLEIRADGKTYKFSDATELANAEAYAVSVLDAVPETKTRLIERASSKPWDAARTLVPSIFEKDSDTYKAAVEFLNKNPQFTVFHDYEARLAHMFRSQIMEAEEKSGKVKYVRLELDDKGHVKLPRKAAPAKAEPRAPGASTTPTRPALAGNGQALNIKLAELQKTGSDDALRAAVAEMLKVA